MKKINITIVLAIAFFVANVNPVSAAWSPEDPNVMHFPQLPDISENGMIVLATPTSIADDFLSTEDAVLTSFTVWGAWLDDKIGPLGLNLAIFSNIPAGSNSIPYGRPGQLLWFHSVTESEVDAVGIADFEMPLYDADINEVIGTTTTVMQYDIRIRPENAFEQQKDNIYWLAIARPEVDDGNVFGWIVSFNKYEASGVFEHTPPNGGQSEILQLLYPITHQYVGQGIDMAFVLSNTTPTKEQGNFDGDWDVDLDDYAIFAQAWLTESGQDRWNSNCDISIPPDDIIDIKDLAKFVEHWLDW